MRLTEPCVKSGKLAWRGRQQRVPHGYMRWWYVTHVGPVEPGQHIHHLCGNSWCIEPTHLEALTFAAHILAHRYRGMLPDGFDETAFAAG